MRRQAHHYHQDGSSYDDQMRRGPSQRMDPRSGGGNSQMREQGIASDRGLDYGNPRDEGQWRSERDGLNMPYPHMLNEAHRGELDKPVYEDQRAGYQSSFGGQGTRNSSFQPRQEDLGIQYADDSMSQGFDSLQIKFMDEIMKLVKEQKDAEDAEYTRHKEKLDTINVQYQDQLTTLRANQATRREKLLQNESNARQQQYQQAMVDQYSNHSMPSNTHSYQEHSPTYSAPRYRNKESYKYSPGAHFSTSLEDDYHRRPEPPKGHRHSSRIYDDNRGFY